MTSNRIASSSTKDRLSQRGVSLIELMVAMTIGLVLVYGASTVYVKSRNTYNDNDAIARLQESARYALNAIEQDVRMSSYWGLYSTQVYGPAGITNPAGSNQLADQVTPSATTPTKANVATGAAANACGTNFATDLKQNIQGDNNGFLPNNQGGGAGFLSLSRNATSCQPLNNKRVTTADTLTVRRANASRTLAGPLQICSTLSNESKLVNDSTACLNDGISNLINDLLVHAYYVDQDSDQQVGLPSLRRMTLINDPVFGPAFQDSEVIAGIEDMQIQFGIETIANVNNLSAGFTGVASQYVNPNDPALNPAYPAAVQIVTVRVWLLVRGDTPETNFTDAKTYEYGDRLVANGTTGDLNSAAGAGMAYKPSASTDATLQRYRRLLVSRTYQVRNAAI